MIFTIRNLFIVSLIALCFVFIVCAFWGTLLVYRITQNMSKTEQSTFTFSDTTTSAIQVIQVYYSQDDLINQSCLAVVPASRAVQKTEAIATAAIDELLRGPTEGEFLMGYRTHIPKEARLNRLSIVDGVAYVEFNSALEQTVAGSCRVSAIRAQIEQTLKQFSTIKNVILSIDGRVDDILQP